MEYLDTLFSKRPLAFRERHGYACKPALLPRTMPSALESGNLRSLSERRTGDHATIRQQHVSCGLSERTVPIPVRTASCRARIM